MTEERKVIKFVEHLGWVLLTLVYSIVSVMQLGFQTGGNYRWAQYASKMQSESKINNAI